MKTTLSVIEFLKTQTDEVVLFYSGGKDSLILCDILTKHFKVNLAFMYFVDGLEHVEKYVRFAEKKYNIKSNKYQHWMVSGYLNNHYYCLHTNSEGKKEVPTIKLGDIETLAKKDFGCEWIVSGMKQSDSLNRRLMLKTYFMNAINLEQKKAYPLTDWNKAMCLSYIQHHNLPIPIDYGSKTKSSGVNLEYDCLNYLKKHYPNDLQAIFKVFPFAETILLNGNPNEQIK